MRSATHAMIALAGATFFRPVPVEAANGNPRLVLLCLFCAVVPDLLERIRRAIGAYDLRVVADPLEPDAELFAQGVSRAALRALETGRPCRVRLDPIPPPQPGGSRMEPWIRLDPANRRVESGFLGTRAMAEQPLPAVRAGWPDRVALAGDESLVTEFRPGTTPETPLQCTMLERGWPHGLLFLLLTVTVLRLVWGSLPARVAGIAIGLHLAVDQAGFLGIPLLAPVRRLGRAAGWRYWNGSRKEANAALLWMSGVILFWNLARHTSYLPWRPSTAFASLAAFLPAGLLLGISRMRSPEDPDRIPARKPRRFPRRGSSRNATRGHRIPPTA